MFLIAGLGNPGNKYKHNRHNVGFMAIDAISRGYNSPLYREKYDSKASDIVISSDKSLLLKPQTYMNKSGIAIYKACNFYKIPNSNVIVFHDELDLKPGQIKIKRGGGTAGHNGLKSITQHIGPDFTRVRIGIGHPGNKSDVHNYVLSDFRKEENIWLEIILHSIAKYIDLLLKNKDAQFIQNIQSELNKNHNNPKI